MKQRNKLPENVEQSDAAYEAIDRHVADIMQFYREHCPSVVDEYVNLIEQSILIAARHAHYLDELALKQKRNDPGFLRHFLASTHKKRFHTTVFNLATMAPDKKLVEPLIKYQDRPELGSLIFRFRLSLRQGCTFERVLKDYGLEIGEAFARGDIEVFAALSASRKAPASNTLHGWLLQAWLPLALWSGRVDKKRDRVKAAHLLIKKSGVRIVKLPTMPADASKVDNSKLTKAIGTVASRIQRRKR